ncbi:MAG: hypothetical protein J1E05_01370 [Eubacterium sp.]|nr:hypothetical protein [Eubacterium sp.]
MTNSTEIVEVYIVGGGISSVKSKNIVGFCHCSLHCGYMTANTIDGHACLEKECRYFEKYDSSEYWEKLQNKEKIQKRENEKREMQKLANKKHMERLENRLDSIKTFAERLVGYTGHHEVHIAKIEQLAKNNYKIFYVTDDREYCRDDFTKYVSKSLKKSFAAGNFEFQRMKNAYGEYATWDEWLHRRKWK